MKEAFEKIKERLEAIWVDNRCGDCVYKSVCDNVQEEAIVNDQTDLCGVTIKAVALSIVSEVEAEYGNGWIPCSERLPEESSDYLVTQYNEDAIDEYCDGYRTETIFFDEHGWWDDIDSSCGWEVLAWMPLPLPYQPQKGV